MFHHALGTGAVAVAGFSAAAGAAAAGAAIAVAGSGAGVSGVACFIRSLGLIRACNARLSRAMVR